MAIGGGILEIGVKHSTIGSVTLFPLQSAESTFDPGGYRNNDDKTAIDGGGNLVVQKTLNGWSFNVDIVWDMNTREDMEKVLQLMESGEEADYTVSHINGTVYTGKGIPVGELEANGMTATIPFKVNGSGKMSKV